MPDPDILTSPCDALVGACGGVRGGTVLQAKGFPYPLIDLLDDDDLVRYYHGGQYVTLRLTSSMYHRFHAPYDCRVEHVELHLRRHLERESHRAQARRAAVLQERAGRDPLPAARPAQLLTLVPVAAILVASIRLQFLDVLLHLRYRGPEPHPLRRRARKGEEMGWFEHGSTIIVFAPPGIALCGAIREGDRIRMGQALMRFEPGRTIRPR